MIKLTGNLFKHAMEFNHIILKDGIMSIHNTDNDGYGYQSKLKPIDAKETDMLDIILSKKDYTTLSKIDEFEIDIRNDVIRVYTKNMKLKLANIVDTHLTLPETSSMYETKVKASDILRGSPFAGNDEVKVQTKGATVHDDCIMLSDAKIMYIKAVDTDITDSINIPKEILKYLSSNYTLLTNGKIAVFKGNGELFYTTLIEIKINKLKDDIAPMKYITFNKNELLNNLTLMKNYSEVVRFYYDERNLLHLLSNEETNEIDIVIDPIKHDLIKFDGNLVIKDIMLILKLNDSDEVTLYFNNRMCYLDNGDEKALMMAYGKEMVIE